MNRLRAAYRDALIVAILFAGGLYLVWSLRHVLLLIYISLLFAVIFMPAVHRIQQIRIRSWHPGRGTAVLLLVTAGLVVIGLLATFMIPPIVRDVRDMTENLPSQLQQLAKHVDSLPLGQRIRSSLTPTHISTGLRDLAGRAFAAAQGLMSGVTDLFLLILLAAYFVANGPATSRWAMGFVPQRHRPRLWETLARGGDRAQRWLTGQMLLMLILGSASTIVFGLLHIRYFYALGLFAGLANFIPVVGPIATVIVAGLVAVLDSQTKLIGVVVFYLAYQQLENAYLSPRIMKAQVGLPGVAVIVALAIGGSLAGIPGALVAVPTTAIIATVLDEYVTDQEHAPAITDDDSR
jgi:predicted PurR-regulated permease PerM